MSGSPREAVSIEFSLVNLEYVRKRLREELDAGFERSTRQKRHEGEKVRFWRNRSVFFFQVMVDGKRQTRTFRVEPSTDPEIYANNYNLAEQRANEAYEAARGDAPLKNVGDEADDIEAEAEVDDESPCESQM